MVRKREGLCGRCWQRHPDRARNQAENLAASLPDPPWWLTDFTDFATERHCVARAARMVGALGRLLRDGEATNPQALLERSRWEGRSAGALARTLEDFLVDRGLAFGLDQEARLAAGRRQRRVDATPGPLRPAVGSFCEYLVRSQERARRAGTHPRADSTIEGALAIVRDLGKFLGVERDKTDWATVQAEDIELFLHARPANRRRLLTAMRQFFRWGRRHKIVLTDPIAKITLSPRPGFTGRTIGLGEQRRLFKRWTSGADDVHPHEALVGLLALLHAMTGLELRSLRVDDVDLRGRRLRVRGRPYPIPLDPASASAVEACLGHRASLRTQNPYLIVTKVTKPRASPASAAYVTHVLDPAGVNAKTLRATRLVDLMISLDPKVVSEALGMDADGLLEYLADHVDRDRLPVPNV